MLNGCKSKPRYDDIQNKELLYIESFVLMVFIFSLNLLKLDWVALKTFNAKHSETLGLSQIKCQSLEN